jgi:hypothetical protein
MKDCERKRKEEMRLEMNPQSTLQQIAAFASVTATMTAPDTLISEAHDKSLTLHLYET